MKTTIISITKSDDIYSIQDKLTWNKSGRVLLKLDGENPLFLSRKDMSLMIRFAKNMGSQIGLVSESKSVRSSAIRYGLPVFSSIQEAQRMGWQQSLEKSFPVDEQKRLIQIKNIQQFQRTSPKELPFFVRLIIFLIAVFAVLSLVTFFIPSATVEINLAQFQQQAVVPIQGKTGIQQIDLSGAIPVNVQEITLTLTDQIECTGSSEVAVTKASGDILIQNLTETELAIPAGTIFSSSLAVDQRYESTEAAVLPAGVNQTIKISVIALRPGESGNVKAEQLNAVEGNFGLFITVSNPEALSGGENLFSRTPTMTDLIKLRARMKSSLLSLAAETFQNEASDQEIFIPGSAHLLETLEEQVEPELGQPSEILNLTQEVKLEGWFIQKTDLERVLTTVLDIQLPADQKAVDEKITFEVIQKPKLSAEELIWEHSVQRNVEQRLDTDQIRKELVGLTHTEIDSVLKNKGLHAEQIQVTLYPAWWQRMPFLESRIEVNVLE